MTSAAQPTGQNVCRKILIRKTPHRLITGGGQPEPDIGIAIYTFREFPQFIKTSTLAFSQTFFTLSSPIVEK